MYNEILLEKTETKLDDLRFINRCKFCHVLSKDMYLSDCCIFCKKYFNYIRPEDAFLFTFKNFYCEIAMRKDSHLSKHQFCKIEENSFQQSNLNPSFSYDFFNMNWYVDVEFENKKIEDTCDTLNKIVERTLENLTFNSLVIEHSKLYLTQKVQNFYQERNFKPPTIVLSSPMNIQKINFLSLNRKNIEKIFTDSLNFFRVNE